MRLFDYPKAKAPTTVLALFTGPTRYENKEKPDYWINTKGNFTFFEEPTEDGYYLTHQQRKSRIGLLLQYPFCWHSWFVIKYQEPNKPGSEIALYLRFGLWRFDKTGTIKNGDLRHWIGLFTWFLGFHYD